jgi:hypothetical protein
VVSARQAGHPKENLSAFGGLGQKAFLRWIIMKLIAADEKSTLAGTKKRQFIRIMFTDKLPF